MVPRVFHNKFRAGRQHFTLILHFGFAFCYAPPISGSATAKWSGRQMEREGEEGERERRETDRVTTGLKLVEKSEQSRQLEA